MAEPIERTTWAGNHACRAVSVVIPTRGRPDQALTAVRSCLAQHWDDLEILLFDDGPDQAAARMITAAVASEQVRVFTTIKSRGSIANRNRGFVEARGDIVFSLDDDAYFTDPQSVARTVAIFEADPPVAAVALPYVEPRERRSQSTQRAPFCGQPGDELRSYVGCAAAFRRDALLSLGGYREFFIHYVEERELAMRLWAAGWRIVYGEGGPIVHNVDPRRDDRRVLYYACRNQLLNEVLNTPAPEVLLRLPWLAARLIGYRFTWASLPTRLAGLAAGLAEGLVRWRLRRPMGRAIHRRWRRLPSHGPDELSGPLPPPCRREAPPAATAALAGAEPAR